ncbi:uncharacterized protein BDV14DRAFT_207490 [Aspergillus stella-maris]|uniref:uncharacterized protein n=1 Tax=Aspergillus stella-maris TaxID=1810926 RepID=UPI003CCDBBA0
MSFLLKHRPIVRTLRAPILTRSTIPIRTISSTHSLFPASLDPSPTDPRIITILERTILSPERAETTCSGTDNAVGTNIHSYDPSITNPESEFATFEEEVLVGEKMGETDPLFISPANREFSRLLDRELDGRAVLSDKGDRLGGEGSVRGWCKKGKMVKIMSAGQGGVTRDEFERLCRGLKRVQMRQSMRKKGETAAAA